MPHPSQDPHLPHASPLSGVSQQPPTAAGQSPVVVVMPGGRQTVWWMLTLVLAVLATAMLTRPDRGILPGAWAQAPSALPTVAGSRGIYAFTGQLTAKTYGLFMMDVDTGTLWCYELQHGPNGEPQMKLVAARSWIYDRFLEEFNVTDPVPSAVKVLVQQQRAGAAGAAPAAAPSSTGAPGAGKPAVPGPAGRQ